MTTTVLQISDCHLVVDGARLAGVDTQASLQAVLQHACSEQAPDAIIASGDIAHDATREVYQRFLNTVREHSKAPMLTLPGNHDVLGVMQMAGLPMSPLELGRWSLIALDSHEDDLPVALVTAADKAQTGHDLDEARGEHCLLATHHPLVKIKCPWLDKDRIQNGAELLEWLSECSAKNGSPRLRGVVFGHAHQEIENTLGKLPVYGAPSTCFQFKPRSATFTPDTLSPGYRWLYLGDDGSVKTKVHRVDTFRINIQLDH